MSPVTRLSTQKTQTNTDNKDEQQGYHRPTAIKKTTLFLSPCEMESNPDGTPEWEGREGCSPLDGISEGKGLMGKISRLAPSHIHTHSLSLVVPSPMVHIAYSTYCCCCRAVVLLQCCCCMSLLTKHFSLDMHTYTSYTFTLE